MQITRSDILDAPVGTNTFLNNPFFYCPEKTKNDELTAKNAVKRSLFVKHPGAKRRAHEDLIDCWML